MKTIKQWLETLPEPYRSQALANLDTNDQNDKVEDLCSAIFFGFIWGDTPEKEKYWKTVYSNARNETPLLEDTVDETQTVLSEVIQNLKTKGDDWNANILTSLAEKLKN